MALITDYATAVTAIGDYLARSDLSGYIPNFLQNTQAKLNRRLRVRAFEATLSGTIGSGVLAVPSDYRSLKFANVSTTPVVSLERSSAEFIYAKYPVRSGAEIPKYIARSGDSFIFGPYPGDYAITGVYYKRLTLLSASNTTNWFTENAPDLLLYGALLEAEPFLRNDARIPTWQGFFDTALKTVMDDDRDEALSGSILATVPG